MEPVISRNSPLPTNTALGSQAQGVKQKNGEYQEPLSTNDSVNSPGKEATLVSAPISKGFSAFAQSSEQVGEEDGLSREDSIDLGDLLESSRKKLKEARKKNAEYKTCLEDYTKYASGLEGKLQEARANESRQQKENRELNSRIETLLSQLSAVQLQNNHLEEENKLLKAEKARVSELKRSYKEDESEGSDTEEGEDLISKVRKHMAGETQNLSQFQSPPDEPRGKNG